MPLQLVDKGQVWRDRLDRCEQDLRHHKERVVALQTENALLHLKVAHLSAVTKTRPSRDPDADLYRQNLERLQRQAQALHAAQETLGAEVRGWVHTCQHNLEQASYNYSRLCHLWTQDAAKHREETEKALMLYNQERMRRRMLHNSLVELRGNIRVFCRVRPILAMDRKFSNVKMATRSSTEHDTTIVHALDQERVIVTCEKQEKSFEFDRVYGPSEKQGAIFEEVKPLLVSLLDGFNVCIMAYGQTGSGKTHTMLGPPSDHHPTDQEGAGYGGTQGWTTGFRETQEVVQGGPDSKDTDQEGLIPRAVRQLFVLLVERQVAPQVRVSVVEVYNNDIRDLLNPSNPSNATPSSRDVSSVSEVLDLVRSGLDSRAHGSTAIHSHSSRSHLVVTVSLIMGDNGTDQQRGPPSPRPSRPVGGAPFRENHQPQGATCPGRGETKLQLVDLAGSESVALAETSGAAFRETSHINRSLAALADTLVAVDEGRSHVPYRNSRLTHLLRDAIGGDSKLVLLLCASPSHRFKTETLHCLGFGHRVRQIQRGRVRQIQRGAVRQIPQGSPRRHQRACTHSASRVPLKGALLSPGRPATSR